MSFLLIKFTIRSKSSKHKQIQIRFVKILIQIKKNSDEIFKPATLTKYFAKIMTHT